jgi:hypothetical protein
VSNNYEAQPDWNDGKKEVRKAPAVNIFDNLSEEKIETLLGDIREDQALARFYEMVYRMIELDGVDRSRDFTSEPITKKETLNRLYNTLLNGTVKEKKMALKILTLKEKFN